MYNQNEPDIFGENSIQETDAFKEAQIDLVNLSEEEFLYRYKATKHHYKVLLSALCELKKAEDAIQEVGITLNIDPEILENTEMLIEDYARLLDQMHSANYWEREGR